MYSNTSLPNYFATHCNDKLVNNPFFFLPTNHQFWDVCSMDHLLARLAVDSHSVSKRIVDLLFKSFFPVNESEKEWCCRCITLIQMNPMAARKFYQFAHKHTAPTNISECPAVGQKRNNYMKSYSNIERSNPLFFFLFQ